MDDDMNFSEDIEKTKCGIDSNVKKTRNYYDGISKGYKNLYHVEQIIKLNYVLKFLPKSGRVLDAGSGDGVLNQFVSSDCKLFSFDLSSELLMLNSNVSSQKFCGSLTDLSVFSSDYFDFISCFSVIQDIMPEDIESIFLEFSRVLVPFGMICLSFVKFSSKKDRILELILDNFEIVEKFEETKDLIFVLKNRK